MDSGLSGIQMKSLFLLKPGADLRGDVSCFCLSDTDQGTELFPESGIGTPFCTIFSDTVHEMFDIIRPAGSRADPRQEGRVIIQIAGQLMIIDIQL